MRCTVKTTEVKIITRVKDGQISKAVCLQKSTDEFILLGTGKTENVKLPGRRRTNQECAPGHEHISLFIIKR